MCKNNGSIDILIGMLKRRDKELEEAHARIEELKKESAFANGLVHGNQLDYAKGINVMDLHDQAHACCADAIYLADWLIAMANENWSAFRSIVEAIAGINKDLVYSMDGSVDPLEYAVNEIRDATKIGYGDEVSNFIACLYFGMDTFLIEDLDNRIPSI